jgi:uncharacterized protein YjbJ (UPF0337 family)
MNNDSNSNNNFFLTFLVGAAAGAVIGLLYAPQKGSETRKKLMDQANKLAEDLQETTDRAIETINDFSERIKEIVAESGGDLAALGLDALELKGNWNQIKGKLKSKFSQLTDDDLTFVEGKENELIGGLQKKLGKTKEQIVDLINDFLNEKSSGRY